MYTHTSNVHAYLQCTCIPAKPAREPMSNVHAYLQCTCIPAKPAREPMSNVPTDGALAVRTLYPVPCTLYPACVRGLQAALPTHHIVAHAQVVDLQQSPLVLGELGTRGQQRRQMLVDELDSI